MRRMAISTAILAAALSSVAFAQGYGGYRNDPYYRDDPYYRGGRYSDRYRDGYGNRDPYGSPRIIDRVRADLERGASSTYYANHQRGRFEHAMRELNRFEDRWRQGKFDKGRLDEVIEDLANLSRARDLDPRMRDIMARDANDLRVFRANRGYGRW